MKSCIYMGRVRHRRHLPVAHEFDYRLFMVYLDLAELERVFAGRWLWSVERANVASFRRADHVGDPSEPLDRTIREMVRKPTGVTPTGAIGLLTHLRYFGYVFNPVSFYYCWSADGTEIQAIVAEVHNTPWNQTHCYVIPGKAAGRSEATHRMTFAKAFHVSPFMPMDQTYDWRFTTPGDRASVHMRNIQDGRTVLDATLTMRRRPITGPALAGALACHPFITAKVVAAIYWQAARLWLKRTPFHPHPRLSDSRTGAP